MKITIQQYFYTIRNIIRVQGDSTRAKFEMDWENYRTRKEE